MLCDTVFQPNKGAQYLTFYSFSSSSVIIELGGIMPIAALVLYAKKLILIERAVTQLYTGFTSVATGTTKLTKVALDHVVRR